MSMLSCPEEPNPWGAQEPQVLRPAGHPSDLGALGGQSDPLRIKTGSLSGFLPSRLTPHTLCGIFYGKAVQGPWKTVGSFHAAGNTRFLTTRGGCQPSLSARGTSFF